MKTPESFLDTDLYERDRKIYRFFKRLQDLLFSSIAIVVLFPLFVVVALLIVIDDPKGGPVYIQKRTGRNGKLFNMCKFRSMYVGADKEIDSLIDKNEADGPVFKIKNDPRITRVGRILRNLSIDELPQLFNIFVGDMSFVGPRPPLPKEVEQYNDFQRQRLIVKPGLTCLWQITPGRHAVSFDRWIDLDIEYIKKRSFLLDWTIVFKTISTVLKFEEF